MERTQLPLPSPSGSPSGNGNQPPNIKQTTKKFQGMTLTKKKTEHDKNTEETQVKGATGYDLPPPQERQKKIRSSTTKLAGSRRKEPPHKIEKKKVESFLKSATVLKHTIGPLLERENLDAFKNHIKIHNIHVDSKIRANEGMTTLLEAALGCGRDDIATWLLEEGADQRFTIRAKESGDTLITIALVNRMENTFRTLVESGQVDINESGKCIHGYAPLSYAIDHIDTLGDFFAGLLLRNNAKILSTIRLYSSPEMLENPITMEHCRNRIQTLIRLGVEFASGLCTLAEEEQETSIHFLLSCGIDINAKGKKNFTALMLAAAHGKKIAAKLLIKLNANTNCISTNSSTALILACKYGHSEIAHILIDSEADTCQENTNGMMAVHYALENGPIPLAQKLMKRLKSQKTSIDLATAYQHAKRYHQDPAAMRAVIAAHDMEAVD